MKSTNMAFDDAFALIISPIWFEWPRGSKEKIERSGYSGRELVSDDTKV